MKMTTKHNTEHSPAVETTPIHSSFIRVIKNLDHVMRYYEMRWVEGPNETFVCIDSALSPATVGLVKPRDTISVNHWAIPIYEKNKALDFIEGNNTSVEVYFCGDRRTETRLRTDWLDQPENANFRCYVPTYTCKT